jgi:hypothetical protein
MYSASLEIIFFNLKKNSSYFWLVKFHSFLCSHWRMIFAVHCHSLHWCSDRLSRESGPGEGLMVQGKQL